MNWIYLDGIEIKAPVGIEEEEKRYGNTIRVNLGVKYDFTRVGTQDNLSDTVDYSELFQVVKEELEIPVNLLETVSLRILNHIFLQFPEIEEVSVELSKLAPPIKGPVEQARVFLKRKRSDFSGKP